MKLLPTKRWQEYSRTRNQSLRPLRVRNLASHALGVSMMSCELKIRNRSLRSRKKKLRHAFLIFSSCRTIFTVEASDGMRVRFPCHDFAGLCNLLPFDYSAASMNPKLFSLGTGPQ